MILGDIDSLRENWDGAALLVPPDDPPATTAALEELIHDQTLRKSFAARARFRALEFTPERMAASYLSAYSELMRDTANSSQAEAQSCAS